jgi:hypothetical protein
MASPTSFSRSLTAALATLGLLALAPATLAQSTDPGRTPRVNATDGFGSSEAAGGLFGESSSPFDLIHRAVLMNSTSQQDFNRMQRGHFNNEAANFRLRQQEALRQQQQPPLQPTPEVIPDQL